MEMARRRMRGIGWAFTNGLITCFDAITPGSFGAPGGRMLIPDAASRVTLRTAEIGPFENSCPATAMTPTSAPGRCARAAC